MVKAIKENFKEGLTMDVKKAFIAAVIGGLFSTLPHAIVVGEYKNKLDTIDESVRRHHEEYTPAILADYNNTKTRLAILETEKVALQKALDDIKKQNEQILARLPQHPLSRR